MKLQCPKCHQYKIVNSRSTGMLFVFIGLATFVFIIGFFLLAIGIGMALSPSHYTCQSCGFKWKGSVTPHLA